MLTAAKIALSVIAKGTGNKALLAAAHLMKHEKAIKVACKVVSHAVDLLADDPKRPDFDDIKRVEAKKGIIKAEAVVHNADEQRKIRRRRIWKKR